MDPEPILRFLSLSLSVSQPTRILTYSPYPGPQTVRNKGCLAPTNADLLVLFMAHALQRRWTSPPCKGAQLLISIRYHGNGHRRDRTTLPEPAFGGSQRNGPSH